MNGDQEHILGEFQQMIGMTWFKRTMPTIQRTKNYYMFNPGYMFYQ